MNLKNFLLAGITLLAGLGASTLPAFAHSTSNIQLSTFLRGGDELDILKQSTLVAVLLEENPKIVAKLKHNLPKLTAYQNYIKTYNDNLRATAPKYLNISAGVAFKTMTEVVALPVEERLNYSYLVYDVSTQFTNGKGIDFFFDLYTDNPEEMQGLADDYQDLIQFDAADPKYHGEEEYRRLEVYAKSGKDAGTLMFEQSLDMIVPTRGALVLCLTGIQKQFDEASEPGKKVSKEEKKQEFKDNVATARSKTLLVCQDDLDKGITAAKIKKEFSYNFKIVSRDAFDQAIINKDDSCCLLVIYPASKTMGAFRPEVNYQHLIVNAEDLNVLLTVTPPKPRAGGMPPDYQKINDKEFKDIVDAENEADK